METAVGDNDWDKLSSSFDNVNTLMAKMGVFKDLKGDCFFLDDFWVSCIIDSGKFMVLEIFEIWKSKFSFSNILNLIIFLNVDHQENANWDQVSSLLSRFKIIQ